MYSSLKNSALLGLTIGILVVLIARFYTLWVLDNAKSPEILQLEIQTISKAWDVLIKAPSNRFSRIAVGLNTNIDLIVSGTALQKAMKIKPDKKVNHDVLNSLLDLQETFHYFFAQGSAAERFFSDGNLFDYITDTASQLPNAAWYIGGNAALIAETIASLWSKEGVEVMLIGPVGPRLQKLLHPDMIIPDNIKRDIDEVHLIMEYKLKEKWGSSEALAANRFIISHDVTNSQMSMLKNFLHNINGFKPSLIVLSGLHLLDGQVKEEWKQKLETLIKGLQTIPQKIPIHLELASMMNKDLMHNILSQVLPFVDSLGLNEQELTFLAFVGNGPSSYLFNSEEKTNDVYKIASILKWILKTYGKDSTIMNSKLSRIHFHSLTYHMIATISKIQWTNIRISVAAGTRIAGQQACNLKSFHFSKVELRIPRMFYVNKNQQINFNSSEPVIDWNDENIHFALSPVLVCKTPVKTVGLGDAISAVGLLFSEFSS